MINCISISTIKILIVEKLAVVKKQDLDECFFYRLKKIGPVIKPALFCVFN